MYTHSAASVSGSNPGDVIPTSTLLGPVPPDLRAASGDDARLSNPRLNCAICCEGTANRSATTESLQQGLARFTEVLITSLTTALETLLGHLKSLLPSATESGAQQIGQLPPSGEFLWKPKAEKDQNLVVLLPKQLGRSEGVRILTPDGQNELAKGKFSGIANGERAHYRFSQPGGDFPNGALVEILKGDGSRLQTAIPDTGARFKF